MSNDPDIANQQQFVSGPWTGFYTHPSHAGRCRMELNLRFGQGRIVGEGHDVVGPFVIRGSYTPTGGCTWEKGYLGKHSVHYNGHRVGKFIQGRWEIASYWSGGFRIWPGTGGEAPAETNSNRNSQMSSRPIVIIIK